MTDWNPQRNALGQFLAGQGGRPKGARNRVGRKIRIAWEKAADVHIGEAIIEVRNDNPATFLSLMLKAIPTPAYDEVQPHAHLSPDQVQQLLREHTARLLAFGFGPAPERAPAVGGGDAGDGAGEAAAPGPQQPRPGQPD